MPPARLGAYLRDFRALLADHGLRGTPYGHFGDGCIHVRIDFDLLSDGRRRGASGAFSEDLADAGRRARRLALRRTRRRAGARGAAAEDVRARTGRRCSAGSRTCGTRTALLNPGILARPARLDENLRFAVLPQRAGGRRVRLPARRRATSRRPCAGAWASPSAVRRRERVRAPTSCARPSGPRARSSTPRAGRARLLHEMLAGEVVTDGWRSHGGAGRPRPVPVLQGLPQRLPGRAWTWPRTRRSSCTTTTGPPRARRPLRDGPAARCGCGWPRRSPPAERGGPGPARWRPSPSGSAGSRPERTIPAAGAARRSWRWLRRHGSRTEAATGATVGPVAGHLHQPPLPVGGAGGACGCWRTAGARASRCRRRARVCCGLTYVSTGQLDRARAVHAPHPGRDGADCCEAGLPVVVLEPSCAAALRTDLPELLPDDPRAARLAASVRTFARPWRSARPDWTPPRLDRPVAGQTHCHQHAVLGDAADRRLREKAGLTGELSGGCCGLAGQLRLRARPLRGVGGLRGGAAAARGTGARRRGSGESWRTATPAVRSWPSWRAAGPGTWRRCWRRGWDGDVRGVGAAARSRLH